MKKSKQPTPHLDAALVHCATVIDQAAALDGVPASFIAGVTFGGRRYNFGRKQAVVQPGDTLPPAVALLPKAARRVYAALCAARHDDCGSDLWQKRICELIRAASPKEPLSLRSVHRACEQLVETGEVVKAGMGFLLRGQTPSLPL